MTCRPRPRDEFERDRRRDRDPFGAKEIRTVEEFFDVANPHPIVLAMAWTKPPRVIRTAGHGDGNA